MKMHLIIALSCLLLAAAAPAASSKDATYTQSTAVVVRSHPWLTRGLPRESLIGIRFWGGIGGQFGGPLQQPITFRFQLKNCTREQLGELLLWYLPYDPAPYGWREGLGRMPGTITESTISDSEFTLTYTPRPNSGDQWIYPRTGGRVESDYIWLTAAIDPAISRDAEIRVSVDNTQIRLQDGTYAVDNNLLSDGSVAPHRVYPYKYRVNAYLRDDRMAGATARPNYQRDVFSGDGTAEGEAKEARLRTSNLTELTLIDVFPIYNAETDTFELSWDRKLESGSWLVNDTLGLERLKKFRDQYHPEARIHFSLTKDGHPQGSANRINEHTLDSMNTGTAFRASVLGHAVGDKYRLAFVDTLVKHMEDYGLDGLDVDWEYPNTIRNVDSTVNNDEFRKYGRLLRDLLEAFFNHGWELAMCTNLGYQMPTGNERAILSVPDFINSMAYGGSPLNSSNQVMSNAVNLLTNRGVPKRRIVVGQAIYSDTSYHLGWDEIVNYLRGDGSKDYFSRLDSDTFWINWSYNGNTGSYHTYTGPTTYRAKCNRIRIEGYGGAMSWGYYSDTRWGTDDLLCLAQNQAQAIWPHDYFWPTPPKAEGYYLLDSEDDWFWFRDNPDNNVRLAGDITFTHDPLPIPTFSHTLDGNGHTITLPKDVWLCTFDNTALFQSLTGTVKDLTVVLEGRVVCRADRKNDSSVYTSSVAGDGRAAVLTASLGNPGKLENVTVRVAAGAEVQGAKQAAAVVGDVWHGSNSDWLAMKGVRVEIDGIVRNLADNSGGTTFNPNGVCAGGLLAKLGEGDGVTGVRLEDCSVRVGAQGRIANETGTAAVAAAGAIGHLATTGPTIQNLTVSLASADSVTSVAGNAPTGNSAQPWLNAYYGIDTSAATLSGSVSVPREQRSAFREKWNPYWLETVAPLLGPGYRLRLR